MAELTEAQEQARKLWSSGDYASAMHVIQTVGPRAVEAAGVSGDDVVLDVACGNGNATLPAARTGAKVTGIDITSSLLEAGKAAAAESGLEIDWIEGDAQKLPSTTTASTPSSRFSAACSCRTSARRRRRSRAC